MDVHEYQAKQLLRSYGIAIPAGGVAATAEEAEAVARTLSGPVWAVKAQIHAGGRGAAGGVKLVHSVDDAREVAELMLGAELATAQTGPQGQTVRRVYIEQGCDTVRTFYLALLIDAQTGELLFLTSPEGGDSIEEIATIHPDHVIRTPVDLSNGFTVQQAQQLTDALDLSGEHAQTFSDYLKIIHQAFLDLDASLIELSPLAVTAEGQMVALDAKMSFDDNALFRHPTVKALRTRESAEPTELAAAQQGLNYVRLEGNLGTLVSGAGLALATLDAIHEAGGQAANFLDVPPMARQAEVAAAFKLLLADQRLQSLLVNVFGGGIMRCDVIADGLISAARETGPNIPIIARLDGINSDIARKALRDAGLNVVLADNLATAAQQAVHSAQANHALQTPSLLDSVKNKLLS